MSDERTSLSTQAARNLATTTKSAPQMQGITPRWLLKVLPWVPVSGGVYRVNKRRSYAPEDGRVGFTAVGSDVRVIPQQLRELPLLSGFDDIDALEALAARFERSEHAAGDVIALAGRPEGRALLIASGKVTVTRTGKYGDELELGRLVDGDSLGDFSLIGPEVPWTFTVKATLPCTVLSLTRQAFAEVCEQSGALRAHLAAFVERRKKAGDKYWQAPIKLAAGHTGEPALPVTFVDYELRPREHELSVAQAILNVHTRVADLYNAPFDQMKEQLRLTIEALRERQEHEMVNNPEFGLLHSVHHKQRFQTRDGTPTPDDMDELFSRRRKTQFFVAHPKAIAAFGRQCNRRGLYPEPVVRDGKILYAWRGAPIYPCASIPVSDAGTTSILAMRTGEDNQGVVALRPASLPEEVEPGLNVRFMGINEKAVMQYLVSVYYSVALLGPNSVGVLENVQTRS